MKRAPKIVVSSYSEVVENIRRYKQELSSTEDLQRRINRHPSWYAIKEESGEWIFGPSKFVGYAGNTARNYLKSYNRMDGKETEAALREWFESVDESTVLGKHLKSEFRKLVSRFGKLPNKRWRVSVAKQSLEESDSERPATHDRRDFALHERISVDPAICGGRPCIRGTRMRVNDIVEMIASGASQDEILNDFHYLTKDDVRAALMYAARALDHALVRAA